MYTVNQTGTVTLDVTGSASFKINSNVDFGTITPNSTGFWISTNSDNDWAGSTNCTPASSACQGIVIENDGNEIINLSFNTSTGAATLIGGSSPAFNFLVRNGNQSGQAMRTAATGQS